MELSEKQLKKLVDLKYSLVKVLKKHNNNGYYSIGNQCYCPFHENTNTKAASIYENNGEESLFCFTEHKLYKSSDALEILLNVDIYNLGASLWEGLTEIEKKRFLKVYPSDTNFEKAFSIKKTEDISEEAKLNIKKAFSMYLKGLIRLPVMIQAILDNV